MKMKIAFLILRFLWALGLVLTAIALAVIPFVFGATFKSAELPPGEYDVLIATFLAYCCAIPYAMGLLTGFRMINLLACPNTDISTLTINLRYLSYCFYSFSAIYLVIQLVLSCVYNVYMYTLSIFPTIIIVLSGTTLGVLSTVLAMKLTDSPAEEGSGKLGARKFLFVFVGALISLVLLTLVMTVAF